MLRNTIMALRCRAASPLEWEVSFLLIQADAASRRGLIQALVPLPVQSQVVTTLAVLRPSFMNLPIQSPPRPKSALLHPVALTFLVLAFVCYMLSLIPAMSAFFALGMLLELVYWATVLVASSQQSSRSD
jgi:hypothetical protein